jgi:hypothetical protein
MTERLVLRNEGIRASDVTFHSAQSLLYFIEVEQYRSICMALLRQMAQKHREKFVFSEGYGMLAVLTVFRC